MGQSRAKSTALAVPNPVDAPRETISPATANPSSPNSTAGRNSHSQKWRREKCGLGSTPRPLPIRPIRPVGRPAGTPPDIGVPGFRPTPIARPGGLAPLQPIGPLPIGPRPCPAGANTSAACAPPTINLMPTNRPATTPVGHIGSPLGAVAGNIPTTIGNLPVSGHAISAMQARGIPPSVVLNTIEIGRRFPGNTTSEIGFFDPVNNVSVIVSGTTGAVVTVRLGPPGVSGRP